MELAFNVQNRPAFEISYSEISNTNLAGKNEVAVEFNLGAEPSTNGANGHKEGSTRNRGRKAAAGRDELVEMRFYIPGTVSKKEKNGAADSDADDQDEDAEETNAANLFYETLIDKAEIGEVAGDTYATFLDVLHLTPRLVLLLSSGTKQLICIQRAIRHRHVRKLIPITRQNLRLQDPISVHQEILHPSEKRRNTHTHHHGSGSAIKTGPDSLSIHCHAIEK
jgi:Structure-specific recognition protein (SSRP1)